MTPEELAKEREASKQRRLQQLERRQRLQQEPTPTRTMSRQERKKLHDDEYVPPND
ncbi:MAG: hypothetical protein PVJ02_14090 [Gemmatimonadota bacterium]